MNPSKWDAWTLMQREKWSLTEVRFYNLSDWEGIQSKIPLLHFLKSFEPSAIEWIDKFDLILFSLKLKASPDFSFFFWGNSFLGYNHSESQPHRYLLWQLCLLYLHETITQEPEQPHLLHHIVMHQTGIFSEKILKTFDACLPIVIRIKSRLPSFSLTSVLASALSHIHAHIVTMLLLCRQLFCCSNTKCLSRTLGLPFCFQNPLPLDLPVVNTLPFNA